MDYIFSSGTCRALTMIFDGREKLAPIHSQRCFDQANINFIVSCLTVKQQIQFIKYIRGDIKYPDEIKKYTAPTPKLRSENDISEERVENIRSVFGLCKFFLFEISSIKNTRLNLYGLDKSLTVEECLSGDINEVYHLDTVDDIINDLNQLVSLLPKNIKIILQTHIRPQIVHENNNVIENREIIYTAVEQFCKENPEVKHFNPSEFLRTHKECFQDNEHCRPNEMHKVFTYFYDTCIKE